MRARPTSHVTDAWEFSFVRRSASLLAPPAALIAAAKGARFDDEHHLKWSIVTYASTYRSSLNHISDWNALNGDCFQIDERQHWWTHKR